MQGYIRSLDGLRAVAILLVMLFHFFFVLEVGWIGVQIFFVLSGFLITSILLKSKENSFSSYIKRFYWRRALRIFPLYYFYLLAVAGIYLVAKIPETFLQKAPFLFTYTFNYYPLFYDYDYDAFFTHLWSLSVEEQFYLFWPFAIFFLNRQQLRWLIYVVVLATPIIRYSLGELFYQSYADLSILGEVVYRLTLSHMDAFAVGAAIPLFNLEVAVKKKKYWLGALTVLLLIIGLANFSSLTVDMNDTVNITSLGYPIGGMRNMQHIWSYTLLNFWGGALILYVASLKNEKSSLLVKVLENGLMVTIGRISYGMYVYHWVIFVMHKKFLHDVLVNTLLSFVVYFIVVFAVSYVSFHFFEKKFLEWKDRVKMPLVSRS